MHTKSCVKHVWPARLPSPQAERRKAPIRPQSKLVEVCTAPAGHAPQFVVVHVGAGGGEMIGGGGGGGAGIVGEAWHRPTHW